MRSLFSRLESSETAEATKNNVIVTIDAERLRKLRNMKVDTESHRPEENKQDTKADSKREAVG